MADSKTRGRSTDRKRLNLSEPYEVAYAKSDRASPARRALLAQGESARSARSGKSSGTKSGSAKSGVAAKRSGASSAKKSGASAKRSGSSAKKSGTGARKSSSASGARKSSGSGARRSSSGSARGTAKSASPAMKRTNAAPARGKTPTTRGAPNPPKGEKTTENTAPKTMREADAVDLLVDDHLEVSALFKRFEKLAKKEAPADERRALAQSICDMLKAHMRIEEEIFYPAARKAGIEADQLDEAQVEHDSAKDLIAQIEAGNPDDDSYDAKVKVLGEYINHHVVEEHTEMFPKCRRAGMDLAALRGEMEARKMSLLPEGADPARKDAAGDDGEKSPGLLAKLSDKLFSSDSGSEQREPAGTSRS